MVFEREKSEFNDSFGYLGRIGLLFFSCDESRANKNVSSWATSLWSVFAELSTHMKPSEVKELTHTFFCVILPRTEQIEASISNFKRPNITLDFTKLLFDTELELRLVYKESGLETKERKDMMRKREEWVDNG